MIAECPCILTHSRPYAALGAWAGIAGSSEIDLVASGFPFFSALISSEKDRVGGEGNSVGMRSTVTTAQPATARFGRAASSFK